MNTLERLAALTPQQQAQLTPQQLAQYQKELQLAAQQSSKRAAPTDNSNAMLNNLAASLASQRDNSSAATSPPSPAAPAASAAIAADIDALGAPYPIKKETFTCNAPGVGQPEGAENVAQGPCRNEQLAAKSVQCRPDWLGLPQTIAVYRCAAQHSTGKFAERYNKAVKDIEARMRQ